MSEVTPIDALAMCIPAMRDYVETKSAESAHRLQNTIAEWCPPTPLGCWNEVVQSPIEADDQAV